MVLFLYIIVFFLSIRLFKMQWNIPEVPATLVPEVKNKWGKPWMWAATLAFACCCSLLWILLLKKVCNLFVGISCYMVCSTFLPLYFFSPSLCRYGGMAERKRQYS